MIDWKETFKKNLEGLITSKKLSDFKSVQSRFSKVFDELTSEFVNRDKSLFDIYEPNNGVVEFHIYKYKLGLLTMGKKINVVKNDNFSFAEISFNNEGFAQITFKAVKQTVKYLNDESIEEAFRIAFEPLTK